MPPPHGPLEIELIELFESAKKAGDDAFGDDIASDGPEVERCVDALKLLGKFPVTFEILASTQVGKRLRTLTKHPIAKIQNMASDLLDRWKKLVVDESSKRKAQVGSTENGVKAGKPSSAAKSAKPSTATKADKPSTAGKADKPSSAGAVKNEIKGQPLNGKTEKTVKKEKEPSFSKKPATSRPSRGSPPKCNDPLRDKVRELLAEALEKVAGEAGDHHKDEVNSCDPLHVAVSVESAMYAKLGKSNGAEKFKYRSIMFNIKDPKNPDLRRRVLLGEVKPERLITMTPEEMASDERQQEIKQIKEKALFDSERGGPAKATTDQFKCGRCGQRKCTYYQMQTRSADEPMTTYVTCVNCDNHWKFC
ncbi:Transcription elongation factor TFIIS [Linum grandiflorum]